MWLIKKILTLKQVEYGFSVGEKCLSGICRLECESGSGELFLTVLNACYKDGYNYSLSVFDGKKKEYSFPLNTFPKAFKTELPKDFSFDGGLIVGLCAVNDNSIEIIAFAKEDTAKLSLSEFRIAVKTAYLSKLSKNLPCENDENEELSKKTSSPKKITDPTPVHPPYPPAEQPDPTVTPPQEFPSPKSEEVLSAYDDEAVATENYYELDDDIKKEIYAVKQLTQEKVCDEDGKPILSSEKDNLNSKIFFEDFNVKNSFTDNSKTQAEKPFFTTVKEELEQLFTTFPSEDGLEKAFLDSRWAKVYYSEDRFYVVGVIKENGVEKYICYGVPAIYSESPPKELDGYCTFIPNSVFDLSGDGYWMMFQDAVSGKCVTPNNKN